MSRATHERTRYLASSDTTLHITSTGEGECQIEIYAREWGGVRYLTTHWLEATPPQLAHLNGLARARGRYSPRPFLMRPPFDPSMRYSIVAFAYRWCLLADLEWNGLVQLAQVAEPADSPVHRSLDVVIAQAEWEGIDYPVDDRDDSHRLYLPYALRAVGLTALAGALASVLNASGR